METALSIGKTVLALVKGGENLIGVSTVFWILPGHREVPSFPQFYILSL